LKILILNWRDIKHPRAGGAEIRLHEVYSPLTELGHEVVLYSCSFKNSANFEKIDGINIYRLGNDWTFALLCFLNLRKWINLHKPDIVIEDLNKLPFYSPIVYKGPLLIQMHHLWGRSIFKETFWFIAFFVWLSEKSIGIFYRKCRFSVVSPSTKKELVQLGIPDNNINIIYNGADLKKYYPVNKEKEKVIIWIGRLQKYKGPIEACKIIALLNDDFPNFKLVIIGDGPFKHKVEQFVEDNKLPVIFTGYLDKLEKIKWLQKASVHIQSSYKEGWGLSVIEANACGCPVVANDTFGLRDSCRHNETGLLYKYNDLNDAKEKIATLLTDKILNKKIVDGGLKWASSFCWKKNSEEILNLITEIYSMKENQ